MFLINGHKQESLAVSDRATQFGDGCFTTARVIDGKVSLLSAHIQRLQDACQRLMISCDFWPQLEQEMKTLAAEQQNGVLKVVISRGSGGRGYSTLNSGPATRILSVTAYPAHYDRLRNEGMTLALSPVRLGRNPHLAGIKHLNRLEQVLIRSHLEQTNADEALVLDSEGWVTECCAANLFWRKGNVVIRRDWIRQVLTALCDNSVSVCWHNPLISLSKCKPLWKRRCRQMRWLFVMR